MRIIRAVTAFLMLIAALVFLIWHGAVSEVYLSTSDFSHRPCGYWSIFGNVLPGTQATGARHVTKLSEYLVSEGFAPSNKQRENWVLVREIYSDGTSPKGPGYWLFTYLYRGKDKDGHFWIDWSRNNPNMSRDFWKAIFALADMDTPTARDDMNRLLVRAIEGDKSKELLQQEIQRILEDFSR